MLQQQRQRSIASFSGSDGPPVMLASLRCAGQGLNLQRANHVFLCDPWWNSAVEEQAIDRVHRLGQRKRVRVVRFIAEGTIEESVIKLQEQKQQMVSMMMTARSRRDLSVEKLERVKILLQ
jgi:SNF2 family DNA or RNA helicase